ncbi:hypothetical protein IB62_020795 [Xanthomonas euvesicatoria]|nr:hypothetical protein IB62_020795 [Xanthomonas euvesicatoria]
MSCTTTEHCHKSAAVARAPLGIEDPRTAAASIQQRSQHEERKRNFRGGNPRPLAVQWALAGDAPR